MNVMPKFGYALVVNKAALPLLGTVRPFAPEGTDLMVADYQDLDSLELGVRALVANDFPVYIKPGTTSDSVAQDLLADTSSAYLKHLFDKIA